MFHCPNCSGRVLTRLKSEVGVLWVCEGCGGRAVALGLLRARVQKDFLNSVWQLARKTEVAARLPEKGCPACRRQMVEVTPRGVSEVVALDVCRTCHFIWFDPAETAQLPMLPPPEERDRLSPEGREAVAMARIDQIRRRAEADEFGSGEMPDSWWQTLITIFGLPVEDNAPSVEKHPWATWTIALTVAVVSLLAMIAADLDEVIGEFGLIPAEAARYGGLTLASSFFLHGGLIHLSGNLYFLLTFGDNVEDYLGPLRFLLLLGLATLAGDLAHIAMEPSSTVPCVGASGGISGIIVYYALRFPHVRLVLFWRWMLVVRWFRLSAGWAIVIWIVLQVSGAVQQWGGLSSISAAAHLGGAAAGVLFYFGTRSAEGEKN